MLAKRIRAVGLAFVVAAALAGLPARAEPVSGWAFMTWSASPDAVRADAAAAGLSPVPVSRDDQSFYALPDSTVSFALPVALYGQPATAYPIFRDGGLVAVRFVVDQPQNACQAVLDGLSKDFGPGAKDERGFSNINWPTTDIFGLTVVVTAYFCWPLFSMPGV